MGVFSIKCCGSVPKIMENGSGILKI